MYGKGKLNWSHKRWVEEYLGKEEKIRQEEWTRSIAVGSRPFVENVKALLGFRARGRDVTGGNEGYQLHEGIALYKVLFGDGNDDICLENTYSGVVNNE